MKVQEKDKKAKQLHSVNYMLKSNATEVICVVQDVPAIMLLSYISIFISQCPLMDLIGPCYLRISPQNGAFYVQMEDLYGLRIEL